MKLFKKILAFTPIAPIVLIGMVMNVVVKLIESTTNNYLGYWERRIEG